MPVTKGGERLDGLDTDPPPRGVEHLPAGRGAHQELEVLLGDLVELGERQLRLYERDGQRGAVNRPVDERHDVRHATDVVLVSMRKRHDVQTADRAAPEVGRHHILTDIQLRLGATAECGDAAAIHQHQLPVGKRDENRVALAHIDRRDLQHTCRDMSGEWRPEQNGQQGEHYRG